MLPELFLPDAGIKVKHFVLYNVVVQTVLTILLASQNFNALFPLNEEKLSRNANSKLNN